jgi:hypothetical protein
VTKRSRGAPGRKPCIKRPFFSGANDEEEKQAKPHGKIGTRLVHHAPEMSMSSTIGASRVSNPMTNSAHKQLRRAEQSARGEFTVA